jgi:hypothetical protein
MNVDFSKLLQFIPPESRVLDLGGWERVFPRANVVVDLLSYHTRKYTDKNIPEHFTEKDWLIADFCSPDFWRSIPDKAFDFVTIGHTLEDIRDPLFGCNQMIRCARAGYIEAPSYFRELSKLQSTDIFSGYPHHRWIIQPLPDLSGLIFKAKLAWAHHGDYLGDSRRDILKDYFFQFDGYLWEGSFAYVEHFSAAPLLEIADAKWQFENVLKTNCLRNNFLLLRPNSFSPNDGKCLWVTEYKLPSEHHQLTGLMPSIYKQYGHS